MAVMRPPTLAKRLWGPLGIAASVAGISLLHYHASVQSVVLHQVFQRLYYVPIVVAAVTYGAQGALATSVLASVLYLPHIALDWQAWPLFELDQYGEVVLFNVVAAVTGVLADRLRAERNRYRRAAQELQGAYADLKAHAEERLRVDRLVTIGRLASDVAHEIRNPLGGLLGCLEILEPDFPRSHPKVEFFAIAKKELRRLEQVTRAFLEFAQPAPPASQRIDLGSLLMATAELARPSLRVREIGIEATSGGSEIAASADAEQVQRAVLNIVLDNPWVAPGSSIRLGVDRHAGAARIAIDVHGASIHTGAVADIFEPFVHSGQGHGLALATARRLVENQHGGIHAELSDGLLRFLIELPEGGHPGRVAPPAGRGSALDLVERSPEKAKSYENAPAGRVPRSSARNMSADL